MNKHILALQVFAAVSTEFQWLNKHNLGRVRNAETWQQMDEWTEVAIGIVERQMIGIVGG